MIYELYILLAYFIDLRAGMTSVDAWQITVSLPLSAYSDDLDISASPTLASLDVCALISAQRIVDIHKIL